MEHVDDEPLHISRDEEEKVVMPDYTGKTNPICFPSQHVLYSGKSATCAICDSKHQDIVDAVLHVHRDHGIKGGTQLVMLGTSPLSLNRVSHFSLSRRGQVTEGRLPQSNPRDGGDRQQRADPEPEPEAEPRRGVEVSSPVQLKVTHLMSSPTSN